MLELNFSDLLGHRCLLWGVAGSGHHAVVRLAVASRVICPTTSSVLNLLLCKCILLIIIWSLLFLRYILFLGRRMWLLDIMECKSTCICTKLHYKIERKCEMMLRWYLRPTIRKYIELFIVNFEWLVQSRW